MKKITTKTLKDEPHRKVIRVTVPKAELERRIAEASANMANNASLRGFRKGRVPSALLRSRYGGALKNRATEAIAAEQMRLLAKRIDTDLLGQPQIEFADKAPSGGLVFNLSFDLAPKVPKVDFGKLKLRKPQLEATPKSVGKALEQLAARTPVYVEVNEAATKGDKIKIRSASHIKGVKGGGSSEEFEAILGQGNFFPQIEQALLGGKAGEERRVSLTLDKDHEARKIAGRRATFDLKIISVSKPQKAKIDDAFARTLKFADLEALKRELRARLQSQAMQIEQADLRASLAKEISRLYPFTVPKRLLEDSGQKDRPPQEKKRWLAARKEEIRLEFVLRDTVKTADIKLGERELQDAIRANETRLRSQGHALSKEQKQRLAERLTNSLLERKVLDYIYSKASIKTAAVKSRS